MARSSRRTNQENRRGDWRGKNVWKYLSKLRTLFGVLRQRWSYGRAISGNLLKDLISSFFPEKKSWKEIIWMDTWDLYRGCETIYKERVKCGRGWNARRRRRCSWYAVCISCQRCDCVAYFVIDAKRESRGVRAYRSAYSFATFICRAHSRLFLCPIFLILRHLLVSAFSQPYEEISDTVRRVAWTREIFKFHTDPNI